MCANNHNIDNQNEKTVLAMLNAHPYAEKALARVDVSRKDILALKEHTCVRVLEYAYAIESLLSVGVAWWMLSALEEIGYTETLENGYGVAQLIEVGLSWDKLLKLEDNIRVEFFKNGYQVARLVEAGVSLKALSKLDMNVRTDFFKNNFYVIQLIKAGASLEELSKLTSTVRAEVFQNRSVIIQFIKSGGSLSGLLSLHATIRAACYKHPVHSAVLNEASVCFEQLSKYNENEEFCIALIVNAYAVAELVKAGIALDKLFVLNKEELDEIFNHARKIAELFKAGIPLDDILDLDKELRASYFENYYFEHRLNELNLLSIDPIKEWHNSVKEKRQPVKISGFRALLFNHEQQKITDEKLSNDSNQVSLNSNNM